MKVRLNSCCLVQPSQPTWTGSMPLTEFDQIGEITHVRTIYFYRPPSDNWKDSRIITTLKTSLSRILTHFYPLAGRLRWLDGARLELDCNARGARLVEASCGSKLDHDLLDDPDFFRYLVPQVNYSTPIEEIPLLIVQLTKFQCGGVSLSFSISHVMNDGQSSHHFLSEWARLARGEPLGAPPFLDRKVLRAGDPPSGQPPRFHHGQYDAPPLLIGQSSNECERRKKTKTATLKLSKTQVETLKNEANKDVSNTIRRKYTRYEAITGHIWRCMCKARGNRPEQPTWVGIRVDIRRRMDPPLPPNFYGNGIIDVTSKSTSGDIIKNPLSFGARRIREAIDSVTSEYVHSAIDYLKSLKDLSALQDIHSIAANEGVFYGNPNLGVTSWMGLSELYGLDFGWGKEILMAPTGANDCDGDTMILPGYDGDGSLVVSLRLQDECMQEFKNWFYQDIQIYKDNAGFTDKVTKEENKIY